MSDTESDVAAFVAAAREFCAWLEGPAADADTERFTALVLLSALYAQALRLPSVDLDALPPADPPLGALSEDQDRDIMARLDAFPARDYWRLEGGEGGEKVTDDVARDLYLTYTAVRPGLDDLDQGAARRGGAIWSWRFALWLDWGGHATHAIAALHQYFHDKAAGDD
jgi:Domain of unknown function (DUF5063)